MKSDNSQLNLAKSIAFEDIGEESVFSVNSTDDLVQLIHYPEWKMILLDLIKKEKMDVWAIDIGVLARKYLKKIEELKETSLRLPANAILASAILLHLK